LRARDDDEYAAIHEPFAASFSALVDCRFSEGVGVIRPYKGRWPKLGERVFVDVSAQVIGDVELGDHASIWMNAVVRGDVNAIRIGALTNVQDNCVLHVTAEHPTVLEDRVTVGHSVTLHGCRIGPACLVGIGSIVLNGAEVGEGSIVAAGALVPEGMKIPPGSLVMGVPAKIRRPVTEAERQASLRLAESYRGYKETYLEEDAAAGAAPR
jgi:carbonic anhydrase/acetyltransferase-like protein (isoleucine patch superfamily)